MSPLYIDESVQRVNSLICVLIAARRDDSHVDPAQLLDELIQLQGFAYSVRDSIMEAKEAALAEPEQIAAHGCHIDLEPGQSADACVFDDGRIEDCAYAWKLQREGKGKEACAEWRPIKLIKPTTRKPLTEEQIEGIDCIPNVPGILFGDVVKFARAVERAHGIGEQT